MSKKDKPKGKKKSKAEKGNGTFTPTTDFMVIVDEPDRHAKQDAEVAAQWAHQKRDQYKLDDPAGITADLIVADEEVPSHQVVRPEFRSALLAIPVYWPAKKGDGLKTWFNALPKPTTTAESDLLHKLQQKMEADGSTAASALAQVDGWAPEPGPEVTSGKDVPTPPAPSTDPIKDFVDGLKPIGMDDLIKIAKTTIEPALKEALPLEAPADPVLQNGNGQAIIHYVDPATGKEKTKGYTRVTTYIDGLDDKTVLTKWKMRTLLEGAAVDFDDWKEDGTAVEKVSRAVKRLDAALADIDQREKLDGELLELRRQELLKEHRTLLEGIADELMELGGAHEKANKGTNLHRLTQIVDEGGELPADTTVSDRRDVEAYRAKMEELDLKVLWCERRVVLDDIQVSGTMDRAYQVKLPGMQRRIRVVGDLKTGSVSWGQGKIACQLALYSRGLGYDWSKPLERERLSLSKAYGLLIHLPQGEGRCEVYLVDLELAAKGLALAAQVREWRREQRRAYDLAKPLQPAASA